jgi:hypothetical protein
LLNFSLAPKNQVRDEGSLINYLESIGLWMPIPEIQEECKEEEPEEQQDQPWMNTIRIRSSGKGSIHHVDKVDLTNRAEVPSRMDACGYVNTDICYTKIEHNMRLAVDGCGLYWCRGPTLYQCKMGLMQALCEVMPVETLENWIDITEQLERCTPLQDQ